MRFLFRRFHPSRDHIVTSFAFSRRARCLPKQTLNSTGLYCDHGSTPEVIRSTSCRQFPNVMYLNCRIAGTKRVTSLPFFIFRLFSFFIFFHFYPFLSLLHFFWFFFHRVRCLGRTRWAMPNTGNIFSSLLTKMDERYTWSQEGRHCNPDHYFHLECIIS